MSAIRNELKGYPDAEVVVTKNSDGPPQGAPINLELTGDDYDELLTASEDVLLYLRTKQYGGVEELKIDVDKRKPQMPVEIDREKARTYGLSTRDIGLTLRTALFGREVGTYKVGEDDYPINVRFAEEYRHSSDALMNQKVIFRSQSDGQIKEVPISAVATASRSTTFSAVKRKDMERVITITSNVLEGSNPTEIISNMEADMKESLALPSTVRWAFTGQQEEQAKEMAFLSKALLIALFLIFLIIVSQFNSVTTPFIIGFSVVFSLIGVLLGLVIFQMEFVIIMTMIGIISLAGVVVNNAIVLIDYTNLLRSRKREELGLGGDESSMEATKLPFEEVNRAIIEGGKTRLRPVLLTAITTVLGLLPLAIGLNIDFVGLLTQYDPNIYVGGDNNVFWKPMSWAIIFGLTFATFLTLIIVPVMYWWIERTTYKWAGRSVEASAKPDALNAGAEPGQHLIRDGLGSLRAFLEPQVFPPKEDFVARLNVQACGIHRHHVHAHPSHGGQQPPFPMDLAASIPKVPWVAVGITHSEHCKRSGMPRGVCPTIPRAFSGRHIHQPRYHRPKFQDGRQAQVQSAGAQSIHGQPHPDPFAERRRTFRTEEIIHPGRSCRIQNVGRHPRVMC